MRKWVSALAVIVALCCAAPALADDPASVYSDFAADGVLSCGHSHSALNGVLNDASLYQYGDPLTLLQLKFVIRKQLAGGCRGQAGTSLFLGSAEAGSAESPAAGTQSGAPPSPKPKATRRAKKSGRSSPVVPKTQRASVGGTGEDGRMVLLGVGLLLLTLASGGWAARRAFTDRR